MGCIISVHNRSSPSRASTSGRIFLPHPEFKFKHENSIQIKTYKLNSIVEKSEKEEEDDSFR